MAKVGKLSLFAVLTAFSIQIQADTWYVSAANGNDSAAGTNWDVPFLTIGKGISVATGGDVILVSNGVYQGGWVVSTNITVRAFSENPEDTIIDGGGDGTVGFTTEHIDALVAGFTVSNCHSLRGGVYLRYGGTMSNCIVRNNTGWRESGGVVTYTNARVLNCRIFCNLVTNAQTAGAGLKLSNNSEAYDCIISNNLASNNPKFTIYGGGVGLDGDCRLVRCEVVDNRCDNVPGKMAFAGGVVGRGMIIISQCVIRANSAQDNAGGLYVTGGGTITHSEVLNNTAGGSAGGILAYGTNDINNCVIRGNTAGVHAGGVYHNAIGRLWMRNCLIANNVAGGSGGGVFLYESIGAEGFVDACTIVSNQTRDYGGGLRVREAPCWIYNTIVASNTSTDYPQYSDVYNNTGDLTNYYSHCCVPTLVLPPAQGNIVFDPEFCAPAAGDYRLKSDSPCVNTGANMPWMADAMDLDKRCRLDRFSRKVDMGCYEYVPTGMAFILR